MLRREGSSVRHARQIRAASNAQAQRRRQCRRRRRSGGRWRDRRRRRGAEAHPAWAQDGDRPDREGSTDPQVRPDHRLRHGRHRAGRLGARTQYRLPRLRARLCLCRRGQAGIRAARGAAGDLRGLPPRQWQGRHAQLCRHPDLGELLGLGRALHGRGGQALRLARRLSQCRRGDRADPRHGLRHRLQRRELRGAEAHHLGLCLQSEHGGGSGRRTRLRRLPDRSRSRRRAAPRRRSPPASRR